MMDAEEVKFWDGMRSGLEVIDRIEEDRVLDLLSNTDSDGLEDAYTLKGLCMWTFNKATNTYSVWISDFEGNRIMRLPDDRLVSLNEWIKEKDSDGNITHWMMRTGEHKYIIFND